MFYKFHEIKSLTLQIEKVKKRDFYQTIKKISTQQNHCFASGYVEC